MNHLFNEETAKTDKICHGCYTRNADRTRITINFMNGESVTLYQLPNNTGKNQKNLGGMYQEGLTKN